MKSKKDDEMEKWENEVLKDASNQAVLAGTTTLASKKASPAPQRKNSQLFAALALPSRTLESAWSPGT